MADNDEEKSLQETLKKHPHLTLEELKEFKELFNLVLPCILAVHPELFLRL